VIALAIGLLGARTVEARPNLLIVSLDTVRADAITSMPTLRRLADRGVDFTYALSAAPWTAPSHAALFTGRDPFSLSCEPKKLDPMRAAPSLMQRLAGTGYEVSVITEMGILTQKEGYADGTAHFWTGQRRSALRNVKQWRRVPPASPWFLVVHTQGGHAPYAPVDLPTPPGLHDLWPPGFTNGWPAIYWEIFKGRRRLDAVEARWLRARYYATARAADRDLARLLHLIEPWSDETLIVVTSDHGEELGEHGHWVRHGHHLHDVILRVPLVIAGPGVVSAVWPEIVSLLDVAPTVLEALGIDPLPGVEGISLLPVLRGGSVPPRIVKSGAIQGNPGTQRTTYSDGRMILGRSPCAVAPRPSPSPQHHGPPAPPAERRARNADSSAGESSTTSPGKSSSAALITARSTSGSSLDE
jgi:hypothetical protein